MDTLPRVSLIVLNWNGRQFLEQSLPALLELDYPNFSVQLIDNASTDGSVTFVRERFPQVEVFCNQRNLGFAAGNNVALRRSGAGVVVLVNPDVVVSRDWLQKLVAPMQQDETIGIAGCKLYYPGGRRIQHAGGYVTYPQALPGHYGLNEEDKGHHGTLRNVDYVIGAALAVKRQVLNEIGLLDEGYFLFFEDADWCLRARRAGYRVVYVPQATAVHVESVVTGKGSEAYLRYMHTSRWRFLLKHYAPSDVLHDTVPAELAWLAAGRPLNERRAVARAYRTTLENLPAIWLARAQDGGSSVQRVTDEQKRQIAERLQALREAAWHPPETSPAGEPGDQMTPEPARPPRVLDLLKEKWRVQERPFASHTPVVGPLIARFREAWNNVAAKWYVRPLVQQQNEFNALVVQRLQALESFEELQDLATELDARVLDNDRDDTALARKVGELTYAALRLEQRLAELEKRLESIAPSSEQKS
jgi:GT2 family glycosyltransferase/chaperonin cofactor prefoldin